MIKRIFSSFLLVSIVTSAVYMFGANGCLCLILVAGILTQFEFYKLLQKIGQTPLISTGIICGTAMMFVTLYNGAHGQWLSPSAEFLFISMLIVALKVLFSHSLEISKHGIISTISGIVYAPFMCCFPIALFGEIKQSGLDQKVYIFILLLMIFVAKSCDIGGMFAGKYLGKHRLAPNFSPKKTVEGFVGGILASNVVGILLSIVWEEFLPKNFNIINVIILSTILSIFSLAGDLVESAIKRLANEKDSGRILPGIGGIFDLTDSLLLSIPLGSMFIKHFIL